jgi:hypothetical protein
MLLAASLTRRKVGQKGWPWLNRSFSGALSAHMTPSSISSGFSVSAQQRRAWARIHAVSFASSAAEKRYLSSWESLARRYSRPSRQPSVRRGADFVLSFVR